MWRLTNNMSPFLKLFHKTLNISSLYSLSQNLIGARRIRRNFINEYIKPQKDHKILDIGCGTAEILGLLDNVKYCGVDQSKDYIQTAKKRFHNKGTFIVGDLNSELIKNLPRFDIVMALGVLHHLNDVQVEEVLSAVNYILKEDGRFVSFDPCIEDGQNLMARFLINRDRGKYVRREEQYLSLFTDGYEILNKEVRNQVWFPYTHFMLECKKK